MKKIINGVCFAVASVGLCLALLVMITAIELIVLYTSNSIEFATINVALLVIGTVIFGTLCLANMYVSMYRIMQK